MAVVHLGGALCANPGAVHESPEQLQARAGVYFAAFAAMGVGVMNVGVHELSIGLEPLRKLAAKHKIALVSASLTRADQGEAKPPLPQAIVRKVGGLMIGYVGLLTALPQGKADLILRSGLDVDDPIVAAKRGVAEAKAKGAQLIVVLSQLKRPEIERMVEAVPEVDLVLGSESADLTMALERVGHAAFADTMSKGKYVGIVRLTKGKDLSRWDVAALRPSLLAQRRSLQSQIGSMASSLRPEAGLVLTEQTRTVLSSELERLRAKLTSVDQQLETLPVPSPDSGMLELEMSAIDKTLLAEPKIGARVEAQKERYPQAPGH